MSPHPSFPAKVPSQTAAVARAAFPRGNAYLRLRDELGTEFTNTRFLASFSSRGRPAEVPWRLVAKNLSDRRVAEATRGRINRMYVLGLNLSDLGAQSRSVMEHYRRRAASRRMHYGRSSSR